MMYMVLSVVVAVVMVIVCSLIVKKGKNGQADSSALTDNFRAHISALEDRVKE